MELDIRHDNFLMLCNVSLYVTAQSVTEQILRRPVLKVLGLNISDILAAAAHRYNSSLELAHLCTDSAGGRIARVYDGVYHVNRGDDRDKPEDFE